MKRKAILTCAVFVLGASLCAAAPRKGPAGQDPASISDFVATLRAGCEKAPIAPRSFQEAVSRVVPDLQALPRCLTPVMREVRRVASASPSLTVGVGPVLAPPSLSHEIVHSSRDGAFAIHYTLDRSSGNAVLATDLDASGAPDYVDNVAAALSAARRKIVTKLGFRDPVSGEPLPVYLANLGGRIDGYTVREAAGRPGFLVIDSRLLGNDSLLRAAVAHQFAHASLDSYDSDPPAWWAEATASWLEGIVAGSYAHYDQQFQSVLAGSPGGLGSDDLRVIQGRLLWAAYLSSRNSGTAMVRGVWEALDGAGDTADIWLATDGVVRAYGTTLEDAFADYSLWLLLRRFPQQGQPDAAAFSGEYATYPAAEIQTSPPLASFGSTYLRFSADGSDGGLRLSFEGDSPGLFQAQLLLTPRKAGDPLVHAVLAVDPRGHGSIGIPWATYSEAILIVGNVMRSGGPATYSFVARPDPTFPFELTESAAEPEGTDVRLTWETRSESGLFGWILYRSEQSDGIERRVNELIVPAIGDGDGPVAYQYQDGGVSRGRTYYYRIVGVTHDGLTQEIPETRVDLPK